MPPTPQAALLENPSLSGWVQYQRERPRRGILLPERFPRLNAPGFVWAARAWTTPAMGSRRGAGRQGIEHAVEKVLHPGGIGLAKSLEGFLDLPVRLPIQKGMTRARHLNVGDGLAGGHQGVGVGLDDAVLDERVLGAAQQKLRHRAVLEIRDVVLRRNGFDGGLGYTAGATPARPAAQVGAAENPVTRRRGLERLEDFRAHLRGGFSRRQIAGLEFIHALLDAETPVTDMVGEVDGGGAELSAGAVTRHGQAGGIGPVFFGVLLDVSDRAINIVHDVRHGIGLGVAVLRAQPAIIHADHDVSAAADKLAGQTAHHIFAVHRPAAAVNDHDARKILSAFGRIDIVFQRFAPRAGEDHVVDDLEPFQRLLLDERSAHGFVLVNRDLELRRGRFEIHSRLGGRPIIAAVQRVAARGRGLDLEDGAGGNLMVLGQGRIDFDLAVLRRIHLHGKKGGAGVGLSPGDGCRRPDSQRGNDAEGDDECSHAVRELNAPARPVQGSSRSEATTRGKSPHNIILPLLAELGEG